MGKCAVAECVREHYSRGYCNTHYQRHRDGRPLGGPLGAAKKCARPSCVRDHAAKGLCSWHYNRAWAGLPEDDKWDRFNRSAPLQERVENYSIRDESGCILWGGTIRKDGYGSTHYEGRELLAHRAAWLIRYGSLDEVPMLDHMCHVRACINADHLMPVTHQMNSQNRVLNENSTTGFRGVTERQRGGFVAQVGHNGKRHVRGPFSTAEEASEVAKDMRREFGFHETPGKRNSDITD